MDLLWNLKIDCWNYDSLRKNKWCFSRRRRKFCSRDQMHVPLPSYRKKIAFINLYLTCRTLRDTWHLWKMADSFFHYSLHYFSGYDLSGASKSYDIRCEDKQVCVRLCVCVCGYMVSMLLVTTQVVHAKSLDSFRRCHNVGTFSYRHNLSHRIENL